MATLPGWNTVAGASSWSKGFAIAGFVALFFVVLFDVLAFIYSERKDALVAAEGQRATAEAQRANEERRRQEEEASRQRNAEIAEANRKATEAQARAEKLEQEKSPRHIDATREQQLLTALKPFENAKVRIWIQQDKEAHEFGNEVVQILQKAGWNITFFHEGVASMPGPANGMVVYTFTKPPQRAVALIRTFQQAGFTIMNHTFADADPDDVLLVVGPK